MSAYSTLLTYYIKSYNFDIYIYTFNVFCTFFLPEISLLGPEKKEIFKKKNVENLTFKLGIFIIINSYSPSHSTIQTCLSMQYFFYIFKQFSRILAAV